MPDHWLHGGAVVCERQSGQGWTHAHTFVCEASEEQQRVPLDGLFGVEHTRAELVEGIIV